MTISETLPREESGEDETASPRHDKIRTTIASAVVGMFVLLALAAAAGTTGGTSFEGSENDHVNQATPRKLKAGKLCDRSQGKTGDGGDEIPNGLVLDSVTLTDSESNKTFTVFLGNTRSVSTKGTLPLGVNLTYTDNSARRRVNRPPLHGRGLKDGCGWCKEQSWTSGCTGGAQGRTRIHDGAGSQGETLGQTITSVVTPNGHAASSSGWTKKGFKVNAQAHGTVNSVHSKAQSSLTQGDLQLTTGNFDEVLADITGFSGSGGDGFALSLKWTCTSVQYCKRRCTFFCGC